MFHSISRLVALALLVGSLVALGGCGGKPMPFPSPESEMGERPGLLTGEAGTWGLYPGAASRPQPPLTDQ